MGNNLRHYTLVEFVDIVGIHLETKCNVLKYYWLFILFKYSLVLPICYFVIFLWTWTGISSIFVRASGWTSSSILLTFIDVTTRTISSRVITTILKHFYDFKKYFWRFWKTNIGICRYNVVVKILIFLLFVCCFYRKIKLNLHDE